MIPFTLETKRLLMRPMAIQDAGALFEMDGNPAVLRYLGNKTSKSIEESRANIENIQRQYERHGIGRFSMVLKETGDVIGWAGLKFITEPENGLVDFYDIGYRLQEAHWGKGYASEAAEAWRNHAFEAMKIQVLYASAHVDNIGSNIILKKIGMQPDGQFFYEDLPCNWYHLKNPRP